MAESFDDDYTPRRDIEQPLLWIIATIAYI